MLVVLAFANAQHQCEYEGLEWSKKATSLPSRLNICRTRGDKMVIYNLEQLSGDKLIDEDKEALKLGLTYGKLEDKQLTYAYRKHDQYLSLAAWKQRADER